jgi:hypothetical protein
VTQLVHQLVGYDRETEKVAYQHDFPSDEWDRIRTFLRADPDDPSMVDVYPVDTPTVRDIMGIIHDHIRGTLDYFIECTARD